MSQAQQINQDIQESKLVLNEDPQPFQKQITITPKIGFLVPNGELNRSFNRAASQNLKKQDSLEKAKASQRSRALQEDDSLHSEKLESDVLEDDFVNLNYKKNPMYKGEPIKKGDFS